MQLIYNLQIISLQVNASLKISAKRKDFQAHYYTVFCLLMWALDGKEIRIRRRPAHFQNKQPVFLS